MIEAWERASETTTSPAPDQGGDHPDVRHVAGVEGEGGLAAEELGQILSSSSWSARFPLMSREPPAAQPSRAARADASITSGWRREVEVVAAGEEQHLAPVHPHARRLGAVEHPHASVGAARADRVERLARRWRRGSTRQPPVSGPLEDLRPQDLAVAARARRNSEDPLARRRPAPARCPPPRSPRLDHAIGLGDRIAARRQVALDEERVRGPEAGRFEPAQMTLAPARHADLGARIHEAHQHSARRQRSG